MAPIPWGNTDMIKSLLAAGVLLASASFAAPAMAAFDPSFQPVLIDESSPGLFDFSQAGFFGGAAITGWFSGADLNADGQLNSSFGELTGFHVEFSGNSKFKAFSINGVGPGLVIYDLDGGPFGDSLGEMIFAGAKWGIYDAGFTTGPCDGSHACGYLLSALDVQEPSMWTTMLLGIGGLGAVLRIAQRRRFLGEA
jgi:hypothetical protein